MNKNVCVIPARGGSKRIPKKNIKEFFGKPLIAYSIEVAQRSELFDDIIVSTDSKEIADAAFKYGASVQMRPKELADDFTGTSEVVKYVIDNLKKEGKSYNYVCTIYPTAPLLQKQYIIEGYNKLHNSNACYSFSATSFEVPVWWAFRIKEGRCDAISKEYFEFRSQDLEDTYFDAGGFYWEKIGCNSSDGLFGKDSIPIIVPRYLVQDIDTPEDWQRAERLYKIAYPNIFDKWNELKQEIDNGYNVNFNEREIVFISMGQNIGLEQYGKGEDFLRPVVIVKKFSKKLFFGIPLTSKIKEGTFFHTVHFKNRVNSALLLQARTFDSKRIKYRLSKLNENEFKKLKSKFAEVVTPLSEKRGSA